jgi:hypothetical protein
MATYDEIEFCDAEIYQEYANQSRVRKYYRGIGLAANSIKTGYFYWIFYEYAPTLRGWMHTSPVTHIDQQGPHLFRIKTLSGAIYTINYSVRSDFFLDAEQEEVIKKEVMKAAIECDNLRKKGKI